MFIILWKLCSPLEENGLDSSFSCSGFGNWRCGGDLLLSGFATSPRDQKLFAGANALTDYISVILGILTFLYFYQSLARNTIIVHSG